MQRILDRLNHSRRVKRALDVAFAGGGLVALGPILAGTTAVVVWKHGWPPYFSHERPGLHGKPFRLVKLRTMTNERGPDGQLLPDSQRLTSFGKALRASSLDELPELWAIVRGDMSLVGPRPLLTKYLPLYTKEQMRRHEVPPGLTGWAQVNGRNALSWEEKFALDVWYVDHWSNALDLAILARTVLAVLRRDGISAEGEATMPEFRGSSATSPHAS